MHGSVIAVELTKSLIRQFTNCFCSRSSKYQSATLRTSRLQVRVLPGVPTYAALAQLPEALRSERRGRGWKSLTRHQPSPSGLRLGKPIAFWKQPWRAAARSAKAAPVAQRRGDGLKPRAVSVQLSPGAPACNPISRGVPLKPGRLQVRVLPRGPIWNVNRTSEPGLGANECVPSGKWRKSTAFRHFSLIRRDEYSC